MAIRPHHLRRALRIGGIVIAVLAVSALGLELGLRWLLFGESALAQRLGARLRRAALYAERWDDEYWRLHYAFAGVPQATPQSDPVLGWRSQLIGEGNFAHRRRRLMTGRRPVLMYGDSFAKCTTSEDECWEGLLERSERGRELCLMNYGVGGYGIDQMLVLMRRTLDDWLQRDPIVIVGILIDDDLDRCTLTARTGPKPWFELRDDGELVEHPPALELPPPETPPPPGIGCYLWRWLVFNPDLLPERVRLRLDGELAHTRETQRLCARLLAEMQAELVERGYEHFVVLFHMRQRLLRAQPKDWREDWLIAELERLGIPWVSSRLALEEDVLATGAEAADYFIPAGAPGQEHLDARGNAVVFRALLRGLARDFDG